MTVLAPTKLPPGIRRYRRHETADSSANAGGDVPRLQLLLLGATVALAGCATPDGGGVRGSKTLLKWHTGDDPRAAPPAGGEDQAEKPPADPRAEPIVTDRPDFTEASSTVGKGRVQLETGYTYVRDRSDGVLRAAHSYPEALLRVGLFADWFEVRVGQNLGSERAGADGFATGFDDLYVGAKLGLTEQAGVLPEAAVVLQATVPTGSGSRTNGRVLPGVNLLFGWDVIEDAITCGGSVQGLSTVDDNRHTYLTLAQSFTVGYTLTERVGAYTEWFAFYPSGATSPGIGPEHYFNGGFTFRPVPHIQFDVRAGVGLNRRADDFFAGSGVSVRY